MPTAFPFVADWTDPVREILAFKTDVRQSPTGAEQRRAKRIAPRRTLQAKLVLDRIERACFDNLMHGAGSAELYLPIWPDVQLTPQAINAGGTAVYCTTAYRDFAVGSYAILRGDDARTFEVVTITNVLGDRIVVWPALVQSWPKGTRLYPARRARFVRQPDVERVTDRVSRVAVSLQVTQACDWTPLAFPTSYRSHPVYETAPEWSEDLTAEYERLWAMLDNGSAAPHVVDTAGAAFAVQNHRWKLFGGAERNDFRQLLYALRGRHVSVWMPTHADDLWLTAAVASGATTLNVENTGLADYGGVQLGKRDIRIQLTNGAVYRRRVTSALKVSATVEQLGIDAALGVAVAPAEVARISYLRLVRAESDTAAIDHVTDVDGTATAELSFRTIRDDL